MIPAFEVTEGAKIAMLVSDMLLATSSNKVGRAGADLHRACGDLKANAEVYIVENVIGPKLANCFRQARLAGATMMQFDEIRKAVIAFPNSSPWGNSIHYVVGQTARDEDSEIVYRCLISHTSAETGLFSEDLANHPDYWKPALSLIAVLIKNSCVGFSLQQISLVLVGVVFTSRQDVDRVREKLHPAFYSAESVAADEMALQVYKALISLHAAVTNHLYETARPLPQMLNFEFTAARPTLVQSYRLYATASRADELRRENKVVHPAFPPRVGRALAF